MLLEIRARSVAPRVALSAIGVEPELAANVAVRPFRERFGCLNREAVEKIRLAVVPCSLQLLDAPPGVIADRDDLQRHDIARRSVFRLAPVVRKAKVLPAGLARKRHSRDLTPRIARVVQDDVVALAGSREVAVRNPRPQEASGKLLRLIAPQARLEFLGDEPVEGNSLGIRSAPRQPVEAAQIEALPQFG